MRICESVLRQASPAGLRARSVGEGRVFRAAPGVDTFTAWTEEQQQGPRSILGVLADETSGTLWACYSDMALTKGKSGQPAILRALDLSSGRRKVLFQLARPIALLL